MKTYLLKYKTINGMSIILTGSDFIQDILVYLKENVPIKDYDHILIFMDGSVLI